MPTRPKRRAISTSSWIVGTPFCFSRRVSPVISQVACQTTSISLLDCDWGEMIRGEATIINASTPFSGDMVTHWARGTGIQRAGISSLGPSSLESVSTALQKMSVKSKGNKCSSTTASESTGISRTRSQRYRGCICTRAQARGSPVTSWSIPPAS